MSGKAIMKPRADQGSVESPSQLFLDSTPEREAGQIKLEREYFAGNAVRECHDRLFAFLEHRVPGSHESYARGLMAYILDGAFNRRFLSSEILAKIKKSSGISQWQIRNGIEAGVDIGLIDNKPRTPLCTLLYSIKGTRAGIKLREAVIALDHSKITEAAAELGF